MTEDLTKSVVMELLKDSKDVHQNAIAALNQTKEHHSVMSSIGVPSRTSGPGYVNVDTMLLSANNSSNTETESKEKAHM